jgi:hypothetical protein
VTEFSQTSARYRDQDCPECGESIPGDALVCPECDARLVEDDGVERVSRRRLRRSDYKPHNGQVIMVLGILSFFIAGLILGPVSWAMGYMDLKKIRNGEMDPEGESQTRTGMICGMIATILHSVVLVATFLFIGIFFSGMCCLGGAAATRGRPPATTTTPPTPTQPGSR